MSDMDSLREALLKISEIAAGAAGSNGDESAHREGPELPVCTPKALPKQLQVRAAQTAREINPMNAPALGFVPDADAGLADVSDPLRIAVLTKKYWGPTRRRLTVSFVETTSTDLRNRILSHMNSWQCGIQFVLTTGTGQVRISRGGDGYWSYLGTDILHIAASRPTMNLQGFTMSTPESEYKRVVRHETGHTLGFPHEHMRKEIVARIDRQKAYDYFWRTQRWPPATVDQQVLTPLDEHSIMGTPADQTSIMCYQLPASITKDGRPVIGGIDINATDRTFARGISPPATSSPKAKPDTDASYQDADLDTAEFVEEPALAG